MKKIETQTAVAQVRLAPTERGQVAGRLEIAYERHAQIQVILSAAGIMPDHVPLARPVRPRSVEATRQRITMRYRIPITQVRIGPEGHAELFGQAEYLSSGASLAHVPYPEIAVRQRNVLNDRLFELFNLSIEQRQGGTAQGGAISRADGRNQFRPALPHRLVDRQRRDQPRQLAEGRLCFVVPFLSSP